MTDLMGVMANLFLPALKKRIFSFQFTNFPPPMEAYTKWELMLYNFNISNEVQNIAIHKFFIWISLKVDSIEICLMEIRQLQLDKISK